MASKFLNAALRASKDNATMRRHVLNRTSPKGQDFIGTCALCGKKGLTIAQMNSEECENVRGLNYEQALVETIRG
jgi:hypothetical protein